MSVEKYFFEAKIFFVAAQFKLFKAIYIYVYIFKDEIANDTTE